MIRKVFITLAFSLGMLLAVQSTASAQSWGLGVSYENRNEEPTNGFGVQLEPSLINIALLDLRLRGHFSYFNESNVVTTEGDFEYSTDVDSYDFGLGAIGAVSLGAISPYVGAGLGSESWSATSEEAEDFEGEFDQEESSLYYYAVGGISLTLIPRLEPYAEFRYSGFSEFEQEDISSADRRLHVGVTLRF